VHKRRARTFAHKHARHFHAFPSKPPILLRPGHFAGIPVTPAATPKCSRGFLPILSSTPKLSQMSKTGIFAP
jgi:hypothetical protein